MAFSVNALFYGDHFPLTFRLLDGFLKVADWSRIGEVRFALNSVSAKTRRTVLAALDSLPVPGYLYEESEGRNVGKYPLMRRMLYDPLRPLAATHVMWFDDDTYFRTETDSHWWQVVEAKAKQHTLLGARYRMMSRGTQYQAIPQQPWYTGKPFRQKQKFVFCTGGWWVADYAFLRKWNYPFPELHHNGGDTMLGEVVRQQGASLEHFNHGLAINAGDCGVESSAERRGIESRWIWEHYQPGQPPNLEHQNFNVRVTTHGRAYHRTPLDRSDS